MEISEKRNEIAETVIDLKKGLKKMRRQDIDRAISLLMLYDQDLKKLSKIPPKPIQKQGSEGLVYAEDYVGTIAAKSVNATTKAVIINDDGVTTAYPFVDSTEATVAKVNNGQLEPIAPVIIEKWMKEHFIGEIPFSKIYATVVSGVIESKMEEIIKVGEPVALRIKKGDEVQLDGTGVMAKEFMVTKISNHNVWLDRGFFSFLPVNVNKVVVIHKTKVDYFKVLTWEQ